MNDIMLLIGNGFDISALNKFGNGINTTYETFYNYFNYRYPKQTSNIIIQAMKNAREKNEFDNSAPNWSDFEGHLLDLLSEIKYDDIASLESLRTDLSFVQSAFSRFLNDVVTNDIIDKISEYAFNNKLAEKTLKIFTGDLSLTQYQNFYYPSLIDNHLNIDINIMNFNYTSLLDNYLFLDNYQFDPAPFLTSNNNFIFDFNPNKYENGNYIFRDPHCHIKTTIFHPHGFQNIPKSLLFGTEPINYGLNLLQPQDYRKFFIKSFCACSQERYSNMIKNSSLFIIYGCSLGSSDCWWWRKIFNKLSSIENLGNNLTELIIYNYGNEEDDLIKNKFIENCCLKPFENIDDYNLTERINRAKEHIFIINHYDRDISFLQFPD